MRQVHSLGADIYGRQPPAGGRREFWTPGTPPPNEAHQARGFIDLPTLNLAAAAQKRKVAVINCCSNEPWIEGTRLT